MPSKWWVCSIKITCWYVAITYLWKDIFKYEISKVPSHINIISKSTFVANFDDGDIYFDPKLIRVLFSHKERVPFFLLIELYY